MSFWGMSKTGKDAQGQLGELPRWSKGSMTDNLARRNNQWQMGDSNLNTYQGFLQNRLQNGFGSPDQIRQWGQQAMPGVDTAIQNVNGAYGGVQTPQQTNDQVRANLDQSQTDTNNQHDQMFQINLGNYMRNAGLFGDTANANKALINGAYPQMMTNVKDTYGNLRDQNTSLGDTLSKYNGDLYGTLDSENADLFGGLRGATKGAYGGLNQANTDLYGRLIGATGNAYGDAQSNLNRLLPAGDLAAATAARSFAPQISATKRRLTAGGIDPNSLEASSVLQNTEAQRGHAMDDVLSQSMRDYVTQGNALKLGQNQAQNALAQTQFGNQAGLTLGGNNAENALAQQQFGNRTNFGQSQFGNEAGIRNSQFSNESGLSQTQNGLNNNLTQGQMQALTGLNNQQQGLQLGNNNQYGQQDLTNSDATYSRTQNIMGQRNQAIQQLRAMGLQDADIQKQLASWGLDLQNQQFNQGTRGIGLNLDQQNLGGQGMFNLGQYYGNQGNQNDSAARAWNQQAFGQYGTDLGIEGQNAGWGTKLIAGLAAPALSLIPGVGPLLGAAAGGLGGGGQFGAPTGGGANGAGGGGNWMQSLMNYYGMNSPYGGTPNYGNYAGAGGYGTSGSEDW